MSAFGLTQFLFSTIAGDFSDKYGRKPMIVIGLCLYAISKSVKSRYFILLLMIFALTFGLTHFEAIYPLYVTQSYGFTTRDISILIMVCSLIGTFNQVMLTNRLTGRVGEKSIISSMLLLSGICLVCLLFSGNFFYVMVITILFFTFDNILRATINTLLSKEAGDEQGFVAGLNNAYMSLGEIFGPALAGVLFDININLPYLFGAFVLLVSCFVSVKWIGRKNRISSPKNNRVKDQAI